MAGANPLPPVAELDHASIKVGVDPCWQALIDAGEHTDSSPDGIWEYIDDSRKDADAELETALTTALPENLIDQHPHISSKLSVLTETDPQIRRMRQGCW